MNNALTNQTFEAIAENLKKHTEILDLQCDNMDKVEARFSTILETLKLQTELFRMYALRLKQLEETIAAQGAIINVLTEGRNEQENTDLG
jgi:hypothetical protein